MIPVHPSYLDVIGPTLEAVEAQTLSPLSVVVVLDGPSPEIERRVHDHPSKPEVMVLPTNSGGPATPRNEGAARLIDKHRPDAIRFLDADDIPYPRFLEMVDRTMRQEPDADLVCTGFDLWRQGDPLPDPGDLDEVAASKASIDLDRYLARTGRMLPSFTVVRTRIFPSIRDSGHPFDPEYHNNQDHDLFVRLLHQAAGIRIECSGGAYRLHEGGISAEGAAAWLCRSMVNRDLQPWFRRRGVEDLAELMRAEEGSTMRKAARHLWRRNGFGDRHTAIRLLHDDILENRSIRSLVVLAALASGIDSKSRRIPRQGDTRTAVSQDPRS